MPGRNGGAIDIGLPDIDGEALDLMVKVARRKGGVKMLVEKYAASRSVIVVGALGFILTEKSKTTNLKNASLLFDAIEKLRKEENFKILGMPLTALKFQIGIAKVWQYTRMPESLYSFLRDCLEPSGKQISIIDQQSFDEIQLDAIDILRLMCEIKIYELNFDNEQRKWLENKMKKIVEANSDNETFQRNISYFFDCINNQT